MINGEPEEYWIKNEPLSGGYCSGAVFVIRHLSDYEFLGLVDDTAVVLVS